MVKKQSKRRCSRRQGKINKKMQRTRNRKAESAGRQPRITANTLYDYSTERITAFGGLLGLIKLMDLIDFKPAFESTYVSPDRKPRAPTMTIMTSRTALRTLFCRSPSMVRMSVDLSWE